VEEKKFLKIVCKMKSKKYRMKGFLQIGCMKGICPLASGSKGNCLYLGSSGTKLLIDVGLSYKMLTKRLEEIGVSIDDIDAVLITHEHTDHISGLETLSTKRNIPVFANRETAKGICQNLKFTPKFKIFTTSEPFEFQDLRIQTFSIPHDSLDPVGLTVFADGLKIGICTDLGYVTSVVRKHLQNCDYLYVEANHQPSLVHSCLRPMVYKTRVLGKQGHLSNEACADLLSSVHHEKLKAAYLAHLSSECNTKELALKVVGDYLEKEKRLLKLMIAHQESVSEPIAF
jgi:phosphoribosyl 1,2-cyclic phosphodiesterase